MLKRALRYRIIPFARMAIHKPNVTRAKPNYGEMNQ